MANPTDWFDLGRQLRSGKMQDARTGLWRRRSWMGWRGEREVEVEKPRLGASQSQCSAVQCSAVAGV